MITITRHVPPKWWEGLPQPFQPAGNISLLLRPRRDQIYERGAELHRRAEWHIRLCKAISREVRPAQRRPFFRVGLRRSVGEYERLWWKRDVRPEDFP